MGLFRNRNCYLCNTSPIFCLSKMYSHTIRCKYSGNSELFYQQLGKNSKGGKFWLQCKGIHFHANKEFLNQQKFQVYGSFAFLPCFANLWYFFLLFHQKKQTLILRRNRLGYLYIQNIYDKRFNSKPVISMN